MGVQDLRGMCVCVYTRARVACARARAGTSLDRADMHADCVCMHVHMRADMRTDRCVDMFLDLCADICKDILCRHACT